MFDIKIKKYPKGNYYVSANCGPELDNLLMDLHKKYNEYAIVKDGFKTLWSSFDLLEKLYRREKKHDSL